MEAKPITAIGASLQASFTAPAVAHPSTDAKDSTRGAPLPPTMPGQTSGRLALPTETETETEGGQVKEGVAQQKKSAEERDQEEARIMSAVYGPEIEEERKERESFYRDLGVPDADARRLVARILAAYAPLEYGKF